MLCVLKNTWYTEVTQTSKNLLLIFNTRDRKSKIRSSSTFQSFLCKFDLVWLPNSRGTPSSIQVDWVRLKYSSMQTSKPTLGQCIDICRSSPTSTRQLKERNQGNVCFVMEDKRKIVDKKKTRVPEKNPDESREPKCKFCSRHQPFSKKNYPAWRTFCGKHSAASQTILPQCFAKNRRRKCCLRIVHSKMRRKNKR